ncbi:MAG: glutaredoxin family protein [Anaerolineales bacterium]|jgi:glutaredoxin|nr:glutaredoxin family protein [Anaerolineales bacterium]
MGEKFSNFPEQIVIFSASWCPDCKRTRKLLDDRQIPYSLIDIGKDNDGFLFIEKLTKRVKIPTLIFPDGTQMIEPSDDELVRKLNQI